MSDSNLALLKTRLSEIFTTLDPEIVKELEGEFWIFVSPTPLVLEAISLLAKIKDSERYLD